MKCINKILMGVFLLSGTTLVYAAPTQLFSNDTIIEYDLDNFSLNVNGISHDASAFSITPVTNGVRLGFSGYLNLYASSYFSYSPEEKMADYSALFSLAPTAGNIITDFNITYSGGYFIETPGSVGASGVGMSFSESSGGGAFSITSNFTGMAVPTLNGQLSATGSIGVIEVFDGYQEVFVGNQQVLDYCELENPAICYYRDEPVYDQVAIYRQEMDLGEASIYLESITIAANVTAVPEPPVGILMTFGLLVLGMQFRRKKSTDT